MGIIDTIRSLFSGFFKKKEYPVYASCAVCNERVYLPFHCEYCDLYFCDRHRLPFNHDCKNIEDWKKRPAPASRHGK
jgi:predicted nucleic acid binding AN1-type Zn finger protein